MKTIEKKVPAINRLRRLLQEGIEETKSLDVNVEERKKCKDDVAYWVDKYCYTYDPRTDAKVLPFKLYPRQVDFLNWVKSLEAEKASGLCEKSRDAGVSYLCTAYALHGWLFKPGFKAGFGSRKKELVDKLGDLDTLFEKIRFMLRKLPTWQIPVGFKFREHDNFTKIINPENGASLTGEGGDDIGRGGRTSMYFVDEAAFLEHPHLAERSLTGNTDVRIDISTPNGPGNPFATKRHSGLLSVFTFHWSDDPRKTKEWAEKVKKEKGPVVFAAEYDLDYSASIEGICIPGAWVRAAVNFSVPQMSNKCVAGLDIGEEGVDKSVFIPRWGPVIGTPIDWGKSNTTHTAWRARDEAILVGAQELNYDSIGVGAGVKGTLVSSDKKLPFITVPVNTGAVPTESIWPDGQTSQEKFDNLKAELWWRVRKRFESVYEYVTQGIGHRPEDMISIPNHPQLIAELSLPLYQYTDKGKVRIESKKALKARGVKSPDFAEALILSEASYALVKKQFWMA